MTKSKNWSRSSVPDRNSDRKSKRDKPRHPSNSALPKSAPGTTDLDRPLKLATARAVASAGFYVRTNVVLSEPRAVDGSKWVADITDVDVLSITHLLDFRADISCATCKAGVNVSMLHETFALAGVMKYLRAPRGYGIFARKHTEPHMIALAQQLDIAVMDDAEWQQWLKRIAGPYSVPRVYEEGIDAAVARQVDQWTNLAPVSKYARSEFWFYRDYRNLQGFVSRIRRTAEHFNGSPLAQYIALDAISLLALSVLQLCEAVNTAGVTSIRDTMPPYLFGGVATYRHRRDLLRAVEELLRRTRALTPDQVMPRLDPPYVPDLMEVVMRYCNRPDAAGRVPQYLAYAAGLAAARVAGVDSQPSPAHRTESEFTKKLALDLIEFVIRSTGLPDVLAKELRTLPPDPPGPSAAATHTSAPSLLPGAAMAISDALSSDTLAADNVGPSSRPNQSSRHAIGTERQPDLLTTPARPPDAEDEPNTRLRGRLTNDGLQEDSSKDVDGEVE